MAEFIDIINARGHMCQKYFLERSIHKCPLYKQAAAGCGDCAAWIVGHPHEAQNIVTSWLDGETQAAKMETDASPTQRIDNNTPTMLSYFFKHTENPRVGTDGVPEICPHAFNIDWEGSIGDDICNEIGDCWKCWTRPIPCIKKYPVL